jgi:hypothetical protein
VPFESNRRFPGSAMIHEATIEAEKKAPRAMSKISPIKAGCIFAQWKDCDKQECGQRGLQNWGLPHSIMSFLAIMLLLDLSCRKPIESLIMNLSAVMQNNCRFVGAWDGVSMVIQKSMVGGLL